MSAYVVALAVALGSALARAVRLHAPGRAEPRRRGPRLREAGHVGESRYGRCGRPRSPARCSSFGLGYGIARRAAARHERRARARRRRRRAPIHRLDPRAKLLGFAGITVARGLDDRVAGATWRAPRALLALAALARVPATDPRTRACGSSSRRCCWSRSSSRSAAPRCSSNVGAKAADSARLSAILLGATTPSRTSCTRSSGCTRPKLLVLIAAFMYRYLFVIVDEVQRMRAALAARGYAPRHALQAQAHRPRRHRALPAHLRARRARAPGDARARLVDQAHAAPGRARLPPRRRALPRRCSPCVDPARRVPRSLA